MSSNRLNNPYNSLSTSDIWTASHSLTQSKVMTAAGLRPFLFSEWTATTVSQCVQRQTHRCHVSSIKVAINANTRASGILCVETERDRIDQANRQFVIPWDQWMHTWTLCLQLAKGDTLWILSARVVLHLSASPVLLYEWELLVIFFMSPADELLSDCVPSPWCCSLHGAGAPTCEPLPSQTMWLVQRSM